MTQAADAYIRLVLDEKQLQKDLSNASGPAGTAAAKGGQTVGSRFGSAFSKGATAAGAGAGTFLVAGIEQATAFEDQLRTINTVAGLTDGELAKVGDSIQALSRETGKGTEDLTAGFYDLVSAGIPASEAINVLRDSAKLAVGALGTTGETVDLVTSVLNAYGMKAGESAKVTDVFAKAVADGKVTAAELGTSIARVAPIAAQAGVSMEELSAGYAVLTAKGIPAAEASTYMRSAISSLLTPNAKLNAIQEKTGLNFAKLAKAKGLGVALEELRKSVGGNEEAFAGALGSIEAYSFAVNVTGDSADAFSAQILETGDSVGLASKQYEEKSKSTAEQGKRLVATFATFAQDIGGPFVGGLGQAVFALNQLGQAFGIPLPAAKILGGVMGGFGGKLVGKLGPRFTTAIAGATATGLEEGMSQGIGAVGKSPKIGGAMGKLGSFMGSKLGKGLSLAFAAVAIFEVIETHNRIKGELAAQSADVSAAIATQIKSGTDAEIAASKAAVQQGLKDLSGVWDAGIFTTDTRAKLEADLAALETETTRRATAVGPAVGGALATGAPAVAGGAADMAAPLPTEVGAASDAAVAVVAQTPQEIADAIRSRRDTAAQGMRDLKEALLHPMTNAGERARLIGYLTSDALAAGLRSKDPAIRAQATATKAEWEAQLLALPVGAKGLGAKTAAALAAGLKDKDPVVRENARQVKALIESQIAAAKAREAGQTISGNLADGLRDGKGEVSTAAKGLATTVARGVYAGVQLAANRTGTGAGRASGGQVQAGVARPVGELGWELFVPEVDGRILSHGDSMAAASGAGAGKGVTVNVYNPTPEPASTSTERELRKLAYMGVTG
jgi:TP901 family phage tail tape measure protein